MITMKLFVDDIRDAPEGWILARSISEAINFIEKFGQNITHISLDHDISIQVKIEGQYYNRPSPDTFRVVAQYIALDLSSDCGVLPDNLFILTHSSNPVGRKRIVSVFEDFNNVCIETPYEAAHRTPPEKPQNAPG